MKSKRTSRLWFFVVFALILAFAFSAFFGMENYYGDTRQVYVKGVKDIRWGIDIRGGVEAVFTPAETEKNVSGDDMDAAKALIETRLVNNNITDYEVYADGANKQIIVRFPWKEGDNDFDALATVQELETSAMLVFRKGTEETGEIIMQGAEDVAEAYADADPQTGAPIVSLRLTSQGAKKFESATASMVGQQISIWLSTTTVDEKGEKQTENTLLSAPSVNQAITGNQCYISGDFTTEQTVNLSNQINSGKLPFLLTVDDTKVQVISPTLGSDALEVMLIAGIIAFALVCLLMIFRYRLNGTIASIALLGQLAGSFACISGFFSGADSFTLTVPGIAGIILSIGVGVDCNVIAAERIRDEFRKGKTIDGAIDSGYKNSLSAIIDGNVTIIIVSLVLMGAFGTPDSLLAKLFSPIMSLFGSQVTGSIYSFGYTLLIGTIFNLIMGVWASKLMIKSISRIKLFRKPWLYGGNKKAHEFKIDYNKTLKPVVILFAVIFIAGVVMSFIRGVNLDINFRGGSTLSYSYTGEVEDKAVKEIIDKHIEAKYNMSKSTALAGDTKTIDITLSGEGVVNTDVQEKLKDDLAAKFKDNNIAIYSSNTVSPTLAGTFFLKSLVAVLITALLVVIYVGIRFRNIGGVSAGLTALAALVIDLLISFFTCVIFGLQIDSNYIAVVLTILGYSLNDTIVIYDRVREYKRIHSDMEIGDLVNASVNKVMIRNIVTTVTTVTAVLTIVAVSEVFGLTTLRTFAIPMAFGLVSGAISSLFVSGPLWVLWMRHKAKKNKKAR